MLTDMTSERNRYKKLYESILQSKVLSYSELDVEIPKLSTGIYNLTVNCEGVAASEFVGHNSYASPFGDKIKSASSGVYFNLTLTNIGSDVTNASYMFYNCTSLISIDTSGFTNVTDAIDMFRYCSNLTEVMGSGFTNVTDASYMFNNCKSLTSIDTSGFTNVTDAQGMFYYCYFLTSIDTSGFTNVTNAYSMFYHCNSLTSIDTTAFTNVINASSMFDGCTNLANIAWGENFFPDTYDSMFTDCRQHIDITTKDWYTNTYINNNASNMQLTDYKLLNEYPKPEVPIVESLSYNDLTKQYAMVYEPRTEPYNLTVDCEGVAASEFIGKSEDFGASKNASPFGNKLKVAKYGVYFNLKLTNVGNDVTSADRMFNGCISLTSIDTTAFTNITNAICMFQDCNSLINITWGDNFRPDPNSVSDMFFRSDLLKTIIASIPTQKWINENASAMDLRNYLFGEKTEPITLTYSQLDTELSKLESNYIYNLTVNCEGVAASEFVGNGNPSPFGIKLQTKLYFNLTLTNIGSDVTDTSYMFYNCSNLISIDISGFTNVTNARFMFGYCDSLTSINTTAFTSVTDARDMFNGCSNLTSIDTSGFTNVTDASDMFRNCSSLTNIAWGENFLPVNCSNMFNNFYTPKNITTRDWYTNTYIYNKEISMNLTNYTLLNEYPKPEVPIVESLSYNELTKQYLMLYEPNTEPYNLTVDCNGVDNKTLKNFGDKLRVAKSGVYFNLTPTNIGSEVTNASYMFDNCTSLISIDTSGFISVTNAESMFGGCSNLTSIIWGDNFRPDLDKINNMFNIYTTISKVITASADSKAWINENANAMSLRNYTFGEKDLNLTYSQLATELPNLEPHYTYNLTVNCDGVLASEFVGTSGYSPLASLFGQKLQTAPAEVYFNLTPINVGSDVTNTTDMFANCNNLISIDLIAFTNIENADNMFISCNNLTNVTNIGYIKTSANAMFANCTNLSDIGFIEGMTTLYNNMFINCNSLTSVNLPNSTTRILDSINKDSHYLSTFIYNGTKDIWESNIEKSKYSLPGGCTIICNNDKFYYNPDYIKYIDYTDISKEIPKLKDNELYDLTIDCTKEVPDFYREYIGRGRYYPSPFVKNLSSLVYDNLSNTMLKITIIVPYSYSINITELEELFKGNYGAGPARYVYSYGFVKLNKDNEYIKYF